jgi:hypothetical protein
MGHRQDDHGSAIAAPRIDPARVPFERTAAYRRFGIRIDADPLHPEDLYAKALIQEQGFDGLPHVVSAAELDRYVVSGEPELFRGVSAARHAEQLRSGEVFVGRGGLGGGIYAAGGPDGFHHAAAYAQDADGVVLRMTVRMGARIAALDELEAAARRERAAAPPGGRVSGASRAAAWARLARVGLYATHLGYDGVVHHQAGVWLLVNRTALRIQREDLRP